MQLLASTVTPRQGFHFTISDHVPPVTPTGDCSFHILRRFPRDVFVDPYELEQRVLDKVGPQFKVWGETDLELPVSAVSDGSLVLLGPVKSSSQIDSPIHARYPLPSWNTSHVSVRLDTARLLTVCKSDQDNTKKAEKVDALFAPYDSPFDLTKVDIGLRPLRGQLSINIPTGNQSHLSYIEPLTILAVFCAVAYMGFAFWKASLSFGKNPKAKKD